MSDGPVVTLSVNDGDRTDGIANASTLLASGMAFKVPITDQRLEQGEKMIGIITSNVTNAQALYSANSEVISTAFTAVGNLMANDVMKKATTDVLNVAKKVIGALDALSGVHPFIGLAVVAFKGIVQFELKRRENDKRVSALMLQATDMFSELLSLNHLSDPDQVLPSGQTIRGRLQAILDKILALVKDMGNCIDKYHKSKTISRFFKSMQWEEKFIGFADTFGGLKKDIKNALIIRSALRIEDAITGVERLDLKLDVIMEMIRTKPAAEQQVAAEVARRGGADAVLNDTSKIKEVIEATETATPGDKKRTGVDKGVEASLLHELRTPLETQLAENRRLFEVTLEMKTNELKEAVQRTQTRILHALNKGAYTRIKDPHIRYVWRSMKWSLSVQTAYFIPAIHDYFSERVGTSKHHDTLQSAISAPVSPGGLSRTGGDDEEDPPTLSNEDEWCLEYLSVYHIPPLKEAFDDDVNGLINVSEVNNFARSRSMPHDWTILQRLAYASHGWRIERYEYAIKIQALINSIIYDSGEVLPANRALVTVYLNSEPLFLTKYLARGINEAGGSSELHELVKERTARHESYLEGILEKIRYEIPTTEVMTIYFDSDHLEHYIMPVIFLLLRHHARVIRLARKTLLDRRELEQALDTLNVVIMFALERAARLAESFRQQGLDEAAKFSTYAGGMYRILWDNKEAPDEFEYWRKYGRVAAWFDIDLDTLSDASSLRYGSPDPAMLAYGEEWQDESTADSVDLKAMQPLARFQHVAGHILAQVQQGRRWDHLKARRDAMAEYSKLAIPAALDSLRFQLDGPKYMSPKQEEIVNKLLLVLSSRDLAYLRAKGDLDLRQAFPVHVQNYCDGCHKSPITNERYDCLDCKADDYQLCRDCVNLPTKKHPFSEESHSVEHNMSLFRFEIPEARAVRFRGAREAMKHCIPAPRYSEGNSETDGKGELLPEICMECKKEMNGQFFTCRSCPQLNKPMCILCDECAFKSELANVEGHSQSNVEGNAQPVHFLVLVRNRNTPYLYGAAPSDGEEGADEAGEPTVKDLTETVKILQSKLDSMDQRMSSVDQRMNILIELVQQLAATPRITSSSD